MGLLRRVLDNVLTAWGGPDDGFRRWLMAGLVLASVVVAVCWGVMLVWFAGPGVGMAETGPASHARAQRPAAPLPAALMPAPQVPLLVGPKVQVTPTPAETVNPMTPIAIQVTDGWLRSVAVTNAASGRKVSGMTSADGAGWRSDEPLGYGSTYRITTTAVGWYGAVSQQSSTVRTLTPDSQVFPSMIPSPGQSDVGVGQPIVVRFDQPVSDRAAAERALQVHSTPEQPGSWFWMSSTEVHYRPAVYWQPGSTVTVTAQLYGVNLGEGAYGETDRTLTFHVHDAWIAHADGGSHTMQIFHNGALVRSMPMSLGSPGHPSHNGPHVISDRQPSIIMDSCTYGVCPGQPGYYRERVDLDERISADGEFVHSAPWSVGQQGSSNVSHGCVNLSPANAQWFYDHFGPGDVVEITNSGGPPLPVWDTYGDWELPWTQWQAGSAL